MILWQIFTLLLFFGIEVNCDNQIPKLNFNSNANVRKLGPCQACKVFVDSFKKGMEKTARGKFEGGDAAWEEEKLRSYARSEVRLVEIQERLCNDVKDHGDQCHAIGEEAEHYIEEWWFGKEALSDDIYEWLCVEKMAHCCPAHHYGKDCKPCLGGTENTCNGNGKCKGDGTRKGNGECLCDEGYSGANCSGCSEGFHTAYQDDSKLLCSPCHKSCRGACSQGGPKGCAVCNHGWLMDTDKGCTDVDECSQKNTCEKNKFCINQEGSFKCLECDKSCATCSGDGPDMCGQCAPGYRLQDKLCIDSSKEDIKYKVTLTRYLTYLGLCITVCIIFQKSIWLAGLLGLLVSLYISLSEYMLANEMADLIDMNSVDWADLLGKGAGAGAAALT